MRVRVRVHLVDSWVREGVLAQALVSVVVVVVSLTMSC